MRKVRRVKKKKKSFLTTGEYAYIPEGDLRKICIPIGDIIPMQDNPRINNNASKELAESIKAIGFRKAIALNDRNEIKAGHTAYKAARILGMQFIPALRSSFDTAKQEWSYVLADNKIDGEWDNTKLAKLMRQGQILTDDTSHGFTEKELFKISNFHELENPDREKVVLFSDEDIEKDLFKEFRAGGFPYPQLSIAECKQYLNRLANLPKEVLLNSYTGYRIADTFHSHRFHDKVEDKYTPIESFKNDKFLKKVIHNQVKSQKGIHRYGFYGFLTMVNNTQACSNFRPAFARLMYDSYSPVNGTVFDPCMGYGGRFVGYLSSHCSRYIGTDPATKTYVSNYVLADALPVPGKDYVFMNLPIENFNSLEYKNICDFCFTSPPYFRKEHYDRGKNQSYVKYKTYDEWLTGFLYPMFKKVYRVLKPGSLFLLNIENIKIRNKLYKLVDDSIEIGKRAHFKYVEKKYFQLKDRTVKSKEKNKSTFSKESVLFFQKS